VATSRPAGKTSTKKNALRKKTVAAKKPARKSARKNLAAGKTSTLAKSVTATPPIHKPLKVALLGFGTVGRSVAKLLTLTDSGPLRLTHIYNRQIARKKIDTLPGHIVWTENIEDVLASDVDIIVEVIGGIDPAGDWVRRALESGKSVVTANKALIAERGAQLMELAHQKGQRLEFGASVAGGIPAIIAIQEGLAGDRLRRIAGILNGTCNFILTKMESSGESFEAALKEAQALGFAEADPRADIEGFDARAKLVILIQAGLRLQAQSHQIPCLPISLVEAVDFAYARELNCSIRQISLAIRETSNTGIHLFAAVRPALIPLSSLVAHVQGSQNLVIATGEFSGQIALSGYGAGGDPTAVAVVSDLYSIARRADVPRPGSQPPIETPAEVSGDFVVPHYVRFVVNDRPGIVAEVAAVFARHGIGIDAMLQKPGYPRTDLPFIMTLEACSVASLDRALAEIGLLDFHVQTPLCLPILTT
jgi:homoserine dehydrogenase